MAEFYRVSLPRTDLKVTVGGVEVRPGLALGSWLAFHPYRQELMVMGDLVLLEREVAPVMRRLAAGGIEVTALHNHLLRAEPATMYLHVAGQGDPAQLSTALRVALQETATPLQEAPRVATATASRVSTQRPSPASLAGRGGSAAACTRSASPVLSA
ncbi:DUF1259 domain-containing protein [Siccirubricoccus deserti]